MTFDVRMPEKLQAWMDFNYLRYLTKATKLRTATVLNCTEDESAIIFLKENEPECNEI
jgi:hypothetical protein